MPTFLEARRIVLDHARALPPEHVSVLDCGGRVLAADVCAPWDLPAWDNSAMDGYAVRASDCPGAAELQVAGYVPAGATSGALARGEAIRILTGAPLPAGADAVVPLEDVELRDGRIFVARPVRPRAHVRYRGSDLRAGEVALRAGTVLGPAEVGLLASFSNVSVPVVRRARVAILATGDELVAPGEPLAPGKIHDSNSFALAAAVKEIGGEPVLLGIARDDRASLRALLLQGLEGADALVTSAGVSMGDRDLVRAVLAELGVEQLFWKVDIRPGRPTAFGVRAGRPVFSLPGNPVATLLTFEQFVRPALLQMMGHQEVLRPLARALLADRVTKKPGRLFFLRVRLERRDGVLVASAAGNQETGIVKTSLRADGVALLPSQADRLEAGTAVDVQVVRGLRDGRGVA